MEPAGHLSVEPCEAVTPVTLSLSKLFLSGTLSQ